MKGSFHSCIFFTAVGFHLDRQDMFRICSDFIVT